MKGLECIGCGGVHVDGEPLHKTNCSDGKKKWTEYRCAECLDIYSRMMWPDDEWGPYPKPPMPVTSKRPS
jgi:hypothetical protein